MFNFQCSIPDLCLCVGDDGRSRRRRRRSVFVIRTQKVVCWFWAALTTTPASPIHITGSIYLYYKKKNVGIFSPTPPHLKNSRGCMLSLSSSTCHTSEPLFGVGRDPLVYLPCWKTPVEREKKTLRAGRPANLSTANNKTGAACSSGRKIPDICLSWETWIPTSRIYWIYKCTCRPFQAEKKGNFWDVAMGLPFHLRLLTFFLSLSLYPLYLSCCARAYIFREEDIYMNFLCFVGSVGPPLRDSQKDWVLVFFKILSTVKL